jgi:formate C-acetyltransferase
MNLVAGLEMALNNGYHPLLRCQLGPETGRPGEGDFETFDQFFDAYAQQMRFLIDNHCELNTLCCEAHSRIRPQPYLSSTTVGCIENALDNTEGGARYNTSGSFNAGLADVTDSMMAVKKLVFDDAPVSFADFKRAIDDNFENDRALLDTIRKRVPLFGSGSDEAVAMANRLTAMIHECYARHRNYRGGRYLTGYWSVSWHSGFGKLSGATPSGRLKGKSFTPGLTPQPQASDSILDNLRDIAKLKPEHMENNIAFNVKYVPNAKDTREQAVDTVFSYVKAYFELGGMQLQFNMIDSETLKDAMAHPENYQNLIVRISGYNARFVELSRDLQIELIERSQFNA